MPELEPTGDGWTVKCPECGQPKMPGRAMAAHRRRKHGVRAPAKPPAGPVLGRCGFTSTRREGGYPTVECSHQARHRLPSGELRCAFHTPEAIERRERRHQARMEEKWGADERRRRAHYAGPLLEAMRAADARLAAGDVAGARALLEPFVTLANSST